MRVTTASVLGIFAILSVPSTTFARNSDPVSLPWSDSIFTKSLAADKSLQEILDSLGYTINVAADNLGLTELSPPAGKTRVQVTLKYKSTASTSPTGWYRTSAPALHSEIFGGSAPAGSISTFSILQTDIIGLYLGPTLYDDIWSMLPSLNWDSYNHTKVFSAGPSGSYVIAWEDLPDGGDQDFNDYIAELRFLDPSALDLSFEGETYYLMCAPDTICFDILGSGGVGTLSLYEMVNGTPALLATGTSPLDYPYCFKPGGEDSIYSFIFQLIDTEGREIIDTFRIQVEFHSQPILMINPDLIDTAICEIDSICFDVVSTFDDDDDLVILSLEEGTGVIDSLTGRICFLPDDLDSADYLFVVRAADSCCASLSAPKCVPACPIDTVIVRVRVKARPQIFTIRDTSLTMCAPQEICFPAYAESGTGDVAALFKECGSGTLAQDQVCFTPDTAGTYVFCFYVPDNCGGRVVDTVRISVDFNQPPAANAGRDSTVFQCSPQPICWAVSCNDPDGNLMSCSLIQGVGSYNGSQICFTPTVPGSYQFVLQATDSCLATDLDTVVIVVNSGRPPVALVRDSIVDLCAATQICIPASCSDPDGDLANCQLVSGVGGYDGSKICFTPSASGNYQFILKATDACDMVDYDTGLVIVHINQPPVAAVGDSNVTACAPVPICIPASCSDPDGNLLLCQLVSSPGTYNGTSICFTPSTSGVYQFILKATDICGQTDYDTGRVTVNLNRPPVVNPGSGSFVLCSQQDICLPLSLSDPDNNPLTLTASSGQIVNNTTICVSSGGPGQRQIVVKIIAADPCGAKDTADYTFNISVNTVPVLQTPTPSLETLCDPTQLCFDVSTVDPVITRHFYSLLSGSGTINPLTGRVCFTPLSDGQYSWNIVVMDSCGKADTGSVSWQIDIVDNPSPAVLPADKEAVFCVGDAPPQLCVPFTYSTSPTVQNIVVVSNHATVPLTVNYASGSGQLCFTPIADLDFSYRFTFKLVNQCSDTATSVFNYAVSFENCGAGGCLTLQIEQTECVIPGTMTHVDITAQNGSIPIAGYDLLIQYDFTAFTFVIANLGPAISSWEFFTYELGPSGNCVSGCPPGLVRLVAIADINNGAHHPPVGQFSPDGVIATLTFRVTNDFNYAGFVLPVNFYWFDCGDNGVSTVTGDTLLIDQIIYDPEFVLWDEFDDVTFPEGSRVEGVGAPDVCMQGGKSFPLRCLEFRNGSICIIDRDQIDKRGDINLNGTAYEIADVVLFTNYFMKGLRVFTLSLGSQTAATDINNDGRTLTVGDLVMLLRILTGDELPIPKLAPGTDQALISLIPHEQSVSLSANASADIGGVYIQAKLKSSENVQVIPTLESQPLTLEYVQEGDLLNILLYSEHPGAEIPAGYSGLLEIVGASSFEILRMETSDYYGNMMVTTLEKSVIPDDFLLEQNYPNPFNPETEIRMRLPKATDWTLTIFNIGGQMVRTFSGISPAGVATVIWNATDQNDLPVATGVYLYRVEAGEFTDTKKMLLVK